MNVFIFVFKLILKLSLVAVLPIVADLIRKLIGNLHRDE